MSISLELLKNIIRSHMCYDFHEKMGLLVPLIICKNMKKKY